MGLRMRRESDCAWARLSANVAGFALGIAELDILSDRRGGSDVAFGRHVAMYLCYTALDVSLTRVAIAFDRDRSTVSYACRLIEDRREEPQFELWINALEAMLRGAPAPGWGRVLMPVRRS